jgi:hypothetical protein
MLQAARMEGYLRPGCMHITLDALLQVPCPALPKSLLVLSCPSPCASCVLL